MKPAKVAIIGASGTYDKGVLARAEEVGVEAVVVTRSPHKFKDVDKENRGPLNCSIYDVGDFCLYCVASIEWDKLAPHVGSGQAACESVHGD